MTRDEAIAAVGNAIASGRETIGRDEAVLRIRIVDSLVALGILKLEEPKSLQERIEDAIGDFGIRDPIRFTVLAALDAAGLRIVEK